jgi:formylglycine-generating enzyme required for sulfatase activity
MSGTQPPADFNPYHKWLGIPEKKCPPTFYELLGISLDEEDRSVIESAAKRQRTHVEEYLGTEWNKFANQVISQIDEAELTLQSPELRREYDRKVNLFKKRRKNRQVDLYAPRRVRPSGGKRSRVVGEGSGLLREYAGIVSILAIAFFGMAAASFWMPWGKLQPDPEQPEASAEAAPEERAEVQEKQRQPDRAVSETSPETPAEKNETAMKVEEPPKPLLGVGIEFKRLPAGTFTMGAGDKRGQSSPAHQVTISRPFDIGIYEVTQEQYEAVMGNNPSQHKGEGKPVDSVSWFEAVEFCRRLSARPEEKAAGNVYRLPTEAEWEYACRAGTTTAFHFGDDESLLGDYAWYGRNSKYTSHKIGTKKPNAWGLYDMHGSAYEWCQDWYEVYSPNPVTDPTGPQTGEGRTIRGGGFSNAPEYLPSARRSLVSPASTKQSYGFRVVRETGSAQE